MTLLRSKPALADPAEFKKTHADFLAKLPRDALPPDHPHGEKSWSCWVNMPGIASNVLARVEVLKDKKAFRINWPKMPLGKAQYPFSRADTLQEVWEETLKAAATQMLSVGP